MASFKEIKPQEIKENAFNMLERDWMLITLKDSDAANPMTASWGGFGVIWNKPVAYIVIRNTRYTYELIEKDNKLALCFFEPSQRDILKFCGAKSGRDVKKMKELGLSYSEVDGYPCINEAKMILLCDKLYYQDINADNFINADFDQQFYPLKDYHRMYICSINKVLIKD